MFSLEHVLTVVISATAIAALVIAARIRPGAWTVPAAYALAILIAGNELSWWVWESQHGGFNVQNDLPLHLCDVAAFVSAAALVTRRPMLVELTYFWGIAGTANGVLTPDIGDHFPSYQFLQYFIQHAAIPGAALFLVVGLRIYPRPWAAVRVFAFSVGLLLFDAFANLITDGNYLFLRTVPPGNNVLDLFGTWPWYIVGGAVLAAIVFAALDLPFRLGGMRRQAPLPEEVPVKRD
jgi:hypothetical integral membrane protein (TIGR02206 family)